MNPQGQLLFKAKWNSFFFRLCHEALGKLSEEFAHILGMDGFKIASLVGISLIVEQFDPIDAAIVHGGGD
jgi:hypothetical protein